MNFLSPKQLSRTLEYLAQEKLEPDPYLIGARMYDVGVPANLILDAIYYCGDCDVIRDLMKAWQVAAADDRQEIITTLQDLLTQVKSQRAKQAGATMEHARALQTVNADLKRLFHRQREEAQERPAKPHELFCAGLAEPTEPRGLKDPPRPYTA